MPNLSMGQMGAGLVEPPGLSTYVFGRYAWAHILHTCYGWVCLMSQRCSASLLHKHTLLIFACMCPPASFVSRLHFHSKFSVSMRLCTMLTSYYQNCAMQDSLTPKERQQAQEVNALCLPVTIHLEDQMIPLPQAYAAAGNSEAKDQMVEANGLWRTDTDGDIAKWLNNGFTPRAGGGSPAQQLSPPCCSVTATGMRYKCIANTITGSYSSLHELIVILQVLLHCCHIFRISICCCCRVW